LVARFAHLDRGVRLGWKKIELQIPTAVLVLEGGTVVGSSTLAFNDRQELSTWCVPKPSLSGTPICHSPPLATTGSYDAAKALRLEAFRDN